jgi:hypothetical protein
MRGATGVPLSKLQFSRGFRVEWRTLKRHRTYRTVSQKENIDHPPRVGWLVHVKHLDVFRQVKRGPTILLYCGRKNALVHGTRIAPVSSMARNIAIGVGIGGGALLAILAIAIVSLD